MDEFVKGMKWKVEETLFSLHNYIEDGGDGRILRKGAISAREGERLIIPKGIYCSCMDKVRWMRLPSYTGGFRR